MPPISVTPGTSLLCLLSVFGLCGQLYSSPIGAQSLLHHRLAKRQTGQKNFDPLATCRRCQPGAFAVKPCYLGTMTVCKACPAGTFTDSVNLDTNCRPCSVCARGALEVECTAVSDTVCKAAKRKRTTMTQEDDPTTLARDGIPASASSLFKPSLAGDTADAETNEGTSEGDIKDKSTEGHATEETSEGDAKDKGTDSHANEGTSEGDIEAKGTDGHTKEGTSEGDAKDKSTDGHATEGTSEGDANEGTSKNDAITDTGDTAALDKETKTHDVTTEDYSAHNKNNHDDVKAGAASSSVVDDAGDTDDVEDFLRTVNPLTPVLPTPTEGGLEGVHSTVRSESPPLAGISAPGVDNNAAAATTGNIHRHDTDIESDQEDNGGIDEQPDDKAESKPEDNIEHETKSETDDHELGSKATEGDHEEKTDEGDDKAKADNDDKHEDVDEDQNENTAESEDHQEHDMKADQEHEHKDVEDTTKEDDSTDIVNETTERDSKDPQHEPRQETMADHQEVGNGATESHHHSQSDGDDLALPHGELHVGKTLHTDDVTGPQTAAAGDDLRTETREEDVGGHHAESSGPTAAAMTEPAHDADVEGDTEEVENDGQSLHGKENTEHETDNMNPTGDEADDDSKDEDTSDETHVIQNKEESKTTREMSDVQPVPSIHDIDHGFISDSPAPTDSHDSPTPTEAQDSPTPESQDSPAPESQDSPFPSKSHSTDVLDFVPEGGVHGEGDGDHDDDNKVTPSDSPEEEGEIAGSKDAHDIVTEDSTQSTADSRETLENEGTHKTQNEHTESEVETVGDAVPQDVTLSRGSIPGAVLFGPHAPTPTDSSSNVTGADGHTDDKMNLFSSIPGAVLLSTAPLSEASHDHATGVYTHSPEVSDAYPNADINGTDNSAVVNDTDHSVIPNHVGEHDHRDEKGDDGVAPTQMLHTPGESLNDTDEVPDNEDDTTATYHATKVVLDDSYDDSNDTVHGNTEHPEPLLTDSETYTEQTEPPTHDLKNDTVDTLPAGSDQEQPGSHKEADDDEDDRKTSVSPHKSSDHIHEEDDFNIAKNVTHDATDDETESFPTSANSTTTDEYSDGHHTGVVVDSGSTVLPTHKTTPRIPTLEEFESSLNPSSEHGLELGSGDTPGIVLGGDSTDNITVDEHHKDGGLVDVTISKEDESNATQVDLTIHREEEPKDNATEGADTDLTEGGDTMVIDGKDGEDTRQPPSKPGDHVRKGHQNINLGHTNHPGEENKTDDIFSDDNDSDINVLPAKIEGNTEDDAHSQRTTAIIVGVAVGGVGLFALGFFMSRRCKRFQQRGEFKPAPRDNGEVNDGDDAIEFRPLKGHSAGSSGIYDEVMEGGHPTQKTGRFSYRRVDNEGYSPVSTSEPSSPVNSPAPMATFGAPVEDDTYAVVNKKRRSNPIEEVLPEPVGINEIDKIRYIDETTDDEGAESTPHDRLLPLAKRHHATLPEVDTEEDDDSIAPPPLPSQQPPPLPSKSPDLEADDTVMTAKTELHANAETEIRHPNSTSSDSMASLGNGVTKNFDSRMTNGGSKAKSRRSTDFSNDGGEDTGSSTEDLSKANGLLKQGSSDKTPIIADNGL